MEWLWICLAFLFVGACFFFFFRKLSRKGALRRLFKDFNRKMWMTCYLGITFFGLYLLLVASATLFIRPWGSELLLSAWHNPTPFIYLGLFAFAFFSLAIYFVRMVIKYIYLTRGKDGG